MKIVSHRGLWRLQKEQNTLKSFENSLYAGFGVEFDVRDHNSKIVISHDPPFGNTLLLCDFLNFYVSGNYLNQILALNIKADGLSEAISMMIREYGITNYFTFDMSLPEMLRYKDSGLIYFYLYFCFLCK